MGTLRATLPAVAVSLALLFGGGCARGLRETNRPSGPPRVFKLVSQKFERETTQFPEKRTDVRIDTQDHEPTPRVVAKGETPPIRLEGARARLYGDEQGEQGWSVDNVVLLEILDAHGKIISRGAVGFSEGLDIGANRIDSVGQLSFTFEPGEVDITSLLPEDAPFRVRATVLDYFGVGRVSDVFLILEYPKSSESEDDLRSE